MKKILTLFLILALCNGYSQKKEKPKTTYKITYLRSSNGKLVENQDPILIFSNGSETVLTSQNILTNKTPFPFEQTIVNHHNNSYQQLGQLEKNKSVSTTDSVSINKQTFEISDDTKIILGYKMSKSKNSYQFQPD